METIKVTSRLSAEERETVLVYDNVGKCWFMDSTVPKHFNKAIKQGWEPTTKYVYEDGAVCGMALTAPARAITIRNVEKKQMTDKQLENLFNNDDEEEDDE